MEANDNSQQVIELCRNKLKEARDLQNAQKFLPAIEGLKEAVRAIEGFGGASDGVREAAMAVHSELALLYQRLGDVRSAMGSWERAESAGRSLPEEDTGRYRLQLATTLVNESGLFLRERMFEQGLMKLDEAVGLIEGAPKETEATSRMLLLGALHNRATIELAARRMGEAQATLERALELGSDLLQKGATQLHPQVIDVAGRLSTVLRTGNRLDEALKVAERGARWAEAAFEGGSAMGPRLYMGTQLQLVDINFALNRLASAEDHLWKAIEAVDDPQTLIVATNFYFSLLRLPEEKLESGDLPSEEVVEALDEVVTRLNSKSPPQSLRDLVSGRYAAMVRKDAEAGREALRGLEGADLTGQGLIQQLLPLLRADVEWAATSRTLQ